MPKLVTAMLVRNEADKYLERVLTRCKEFSDEVVVLDDGSTDGSDRLAWRLGCDVHHRTGATMWGNESPARAELWELGAKAAGDGWLLIADADMLLHGDPRPLTLSQQHNSWAFVLYDCWTDERYFRHDGPWQGHLYPRPWMFRPSSMKKPPKWPPKGIHCGHAPANFEYNLGTPGPIDKQECGESLYPFWLHLAYVTAEHREAKLSQYLSKAEQLTPFELMHARSIAD